MSSPTPVPDDATRAHALPDAWLGAIDEAAATLLGPHDRRGAALATEVARLSELYTRDRGALRAQSAALAARLRFFLPRDLPKIEGPLAELAWAGALPRGELASRTRGESGAGGAAQRTWRVLDLGAGLGTTTLGVATFARRAGVGALDVLAIERDPRALDVMRHLAACCGRGALAAHTVPIALETRELDLEHVDLRALAAPGGGGGRYDLVVIGLALNELHADRDDPIDRRLALLARASELLADDGALIAIEPALRASARELQALRDAVVARAEAQGAPPYVFAPCTRGGACPMLARERDWCHEDLPLALPDALREIARGAGLRWEGLSYAYLTLRRAPGSIAAGAYRVVGGPIASKGRTEWHGCGEAGLVRIARLDRHRGAAGDPLDDARRGSLVDIDGAEVTGAVRTDRQQVRRVR